MAKKYVPAGVFLTCDKGTLPATFNVTFNARTSIYGQNLATDLDKIPVVNVPPMGVCSITKMPCLVVPITWSPVKNDVQLGPAHLLLEDSTLQCGLGGKVGIHFSMAAAQAACAPPPAPDKSLADQADEYLQTLGPLGDVGRFQLGVAEGVWEGGKGLAEGLWGMAKGGWNAVTHPVDTAKAIGEGATNAYKWAGDSQNWANAASSAKQGVSNAAEWASNGENWQKVGDKLQNMSPRDWGNVTGQVAFEVGLTVGTAGAGAALNAAAKTSRVARMASRAARLADVEGHVMSLAGRAARSAAGKMKVMGKVLTGAKKARKAEKAAAKAGKKAKKLDAVPGCTKSKRTCVKDPVDVATGVMLFDLVDLELPGPIPFVWERTWYSNSEYQGPLGHGWHHRYDLALAVEDDGTLALRLADGRLALFEPLTAANQYRAFNRRERLDARLVDGQYRILDLQEQVFYCFRIPTTSDATIQEPEPYKLSSIENANGFAIGFAYDEQHRLQTIYDSAGREVRLLLDANGRIATLEAPSPEGAGHFAVVHYHYDALGNLIKETDALGHIRRYGYRGHLMVQKTLRSGLSFYFEYAGQGSAAQCIRTWGDGNILNGQFTYEPGQTTVSSSIPGDVSVYQHEGGLVLAHLDPLGAVHQWSYNQYDELTLERDPLGRATSYDYDARGNLIATAFPGGAKIQTEFANDLPVAAADDLGNTWQWSYDEAGNQIQRLDSDGLTIESSYRNGLLHSVGAAQSPPTLFFYDEQHNLREVQQPDGQLRRWQHDALGQLTALTDARGNTQRRSYDLLGRLTRVDEPDGNVRWLTYDAEGNVLRARDDHQDVTLEYTGLDWLAARTQAGRKIRYEYDLEGRLTRLINEHGRPYQFAFNAAGQIVAETGFDGLQRRFERDAAGQVVTQWVGKRETHYAYDAAGRITAVTFPDGTQEEFAFRSDGSLLEARNEALTVTWERDARGRVLHEIQGAHRVSSTYDQVGQRIGLHSSLGAAVNLERDDYGDVARMHASGWNARFERDAQGLEMARTLSGGVQTHWHRDQLGRPINQQLIAGRQQRRRTYRWQGPDQLTELIDSATGTTRFAHDARGTLSATLYPDGTEELRLPDAVGNLFQTTAHNDRTYGKAGELLQANGMQYHYDALGNLIEKQTAKGQRWHYHWNAAGHLAQVTRPDGATVSFTYDALGRRISKHFKGKVTRWVWDGNKPLHEWQELELDGNNTADVITWLFEEDSFAPLAKLAGQKRYSILTDHLGTPLEMVDERGHSSWNAQLGSYGQLRLLEGTRAACPFRYQGQYEDTETGLYYNRFRYYDPEAGSYISQDPIGLLGGIAPYAYVADPHKQVDIFGLSGCKGIRKSNPWNEFQKRAKGVDGKSKQFKNSRDAARAYRHFQNGEYEQMAELLDLSSPHGKAVFWSGDWPEAQRYADKIKGTTMEATPGGNIFNNWKHLDDKFEYGQWGTGGPKDAQPLWEALSRRYANQSSGPVTVVRNKVGMMWKNVEYEELNKRASLPHITYIETVPLPKP
ncbi:DUF6531 domain-containing protein [Hymenobacter cellulosivorans]|uniref:DUF6531 domain-containing protein n=1 Tax=Hymenobacter cellulosivorans TaxID=2932249 RepID=A0ABY4FHX6_9BACT|nr:DUF6531 domain-containing protein [Hymenobacter cellulosivorans]UOQ55547.1 DUF6531 domain-containing protein [Hymenobacter cellulosivorans]